MSKNKKDVRSKPLTLEEAFKESIERYGEMYESMATYESFEKFCEYYDLDITKIDYESLSSSDRLLFKHWLDSYVKSQEFNSERGQRMYDAIMDGYRICIYKLIEL